MIYMLQKVLMERFLPTLDKRVIALWFVISDHQGSVQAANRGVLDHAQVPEVAEALALRQALVFAKNSGFQKIEVVSDCLSLIHKVQSSGFDRSSIGSIVRDIKIRASMFLSCKFKHVNRCSNEVAHVLAKSAEHDAGSCGIIVYLMLSRPLFVMRRL